MDEDQDRRKASGLFILGDTDALRSSGELTPRTPANSEFARTRMCEVGLRSGVKRLAYHVRTA